MMFELAKGSQRYKDLFSDGKMPDEGKVMLQRKCFQNGSSCAKTVSTWRRNAELFIAHRYIIFAFAARVKEIQPHLILLVVRIEILL